MAFSPRPFRSALLAVLLGSVLRKTHISYQSPPSRSGAQIDFYELNGMSFLGEANIHSTVAENTHFLDLCAILKLKGILVKPIGVDNPAKLTRVYADLSRFKMGKALEKGFTGIGQCAVIIDSAAELYSVGFPLVAGFVEPPYGIVALLFQVKLCLFPKISAICLVEDLLNDLLVIKRIISSS